MLQDLSVFNNQFDYLFVVADHDHVERGARSSRQEICMGNAIKFTMRTMPSVYCYQYDVSSVICSRFKCAMIVELVIFTVTVTLVPWMLSISPGGDGSQYITTEPLELNFHFKNVGTE